MVAEQFVKNNFVTFKHKNLYLFLFLIFVSSSIFLVFYFNKKQEKIIDDHKISIEIKKDDKYWRQYGEQIFYKMNKSIDSKNQLIGETGKEFQNDANTALGYFNKAKELNPNSYENWLALAKFQDFLVPYVSDIEKDAIASYLHIIKTFPKNNDVIRQTVRVLIITSDKALLMGKIKDSKDGLEIANRLAKILSQDDPVNLYGQYYNALIARRQKNFDFSTSTLEQIKPFLSNEPDLYFELAQAYLETNQLEKAKNNFIIASKLSDIYKKNSERYLRIIEEKIKQSEIQTTSTKK